MAALSDAGAPSLIELRHVRPAELEPLLVEETALWRQRLDWDFTPSANLVRRFIGIGALAGYALKIGGEVAGYSYYVTEESKGLIGDLYVAERRRSRELEDRLFEAVVASMVTSPYIRRIEAQLMLLAETLTRTLPYPRYVKRYQRDFMVIGAEQVRCLEPGSIAGRYRIMAWSPRFQEEAAQVIAAAYRGHVDSEINDQYQSVSGARRFLLNIVQYPGCGSFFQPGSFVAVDEHRQVLAGLCLASLVSPEAGHITQICLLPEVRGTGLGYELLRRSLESIIAHGCTEATLTVTASNREAVTLYEHVGFQTRHSFAALVWEGFQ